MPVRSANVGSDSTLEDPSGRNRFWLPSVRRTLAEGPGLSAGLYTIEIVCSAPRYVTLHILLADASLAPLIVPLDPVTQGHYRKTFSLAGPAREAWVEVAATENTTDVQSVTLRRTGWRDRVALGLKAALRHATSPITLGAKARQVIGPSGNFVFRSSESVGAAAVEEIYRNWQLAFESQQETQRVAAALEQHIGARSVRVLAMIAHWDHGAEALQELLDSLARARNVTVAVLAIGSADWRVAIAPGIRAEDWQHHAVGPDAALPTEVLAQAIERTSADLVLFLERPGRFHELAVACLALGLALAPDASTVYADHDHLGATGGRGMPVFKPAWSPDYEMGWDYVAQPVAFRGDAQAFRALTDKIPQAGAKYGALMHLALDADHAGAVQHIPRVLFHDRMTAPETRHGLTREAAEQRVLERLLGCGDEISPVGRETSFPLRRLTRAVASTSRPAISVIIPSRDNPDLLARACHSVATAFGVGAGLIIVDNGATSPAQLKLYENLKMDQNARIVSDPGPFNFSRLVNRGRIPCESEIIVLLNDDVEALDTLWLRELTSNAQRSDIGCVGALLLYPDGRIQHAGVTLGINGGAGHAFRFAPGESDGDGFRLRVAHEVSAVTAACLAVRTRVFDEVGGFEEDLPVALNDVDFCLKVRARGYRNLFTPHARLIHRESTSRGLDVSPRQLQRLLRETAIFHRHWGEAALNDPYYSPHLSLSHDDFRPRAL